MTLIALLAIVVPAFIFAAGAADNKASGSSGAVTLEFSTQEVGTGMYTYATAITQVVRPVLPAGSTIDLTTTSPGGVGSPIIIERGEADLTLGNAAPAKWATDKGILGQPPTTKVRSIAGGMGQDFVNVIFTKAFVDKTGITTVEDVVAKKYPVRIAIKANGAFGELACARVLQALGADYDTVKSWGGSVTQTGSDAIVNLLRDDKADMTIDHVGAGQAATTELCLTASMFFPVLAPSTRAKLNELGFDNITIPANTWKGQTADIPSVGSPITVLCTSSLSNDLVYTITKAICENKPALVQSYAAFRYFDPATAWDPLKTGAPLHPGAEKYYREKGYLK